MTSCPSCRAARRSNFGSSLRALGIVRRELEHADEHAALHAAALASVGCPTSASWLWRSASGRLARRDQRVRPRCATTVRAKLEVANPGYLQTGRTSIGRRR